MNALFSLWEKLSRGKEHRESFGSSVVKRMIPRQIRVLRRQFKLSQSELAEASGLTQGVISRAEDPAYGNLTINTLIRIAAGFDCAFVGHFVAFSDLAKWYVGLDDETSLEVRPFAQDSIEETSQVVSQFHLQSAFIRRDWSPNFTTWRQIPPSAQFQVESFKRSVTDISTYYSKNSVNQIRKDMNTSFVAYSNSSQQEILRAEAQG